MPDETLTPAEARARFGDLVDRQSGAHREFDTAGAGVWRPRFGPGMTLAEYRLWRPLKVKPTVWRRSKPRR